MNEPQRRLPPRPRDELPTDYRIVASGVPDMPAKYQVLHGRGRAEQFVGIRVIAQGRLKQRSYETSDYEKRTVVELEVEDVRPSLRTVTAKINRAQRG